MEIWKLEHVSVHQKKDIIYQLALRCDHSTFENVFHDSPSLISDDAGKKAFRN